MPWNLILGFGTNALKLWSNRRKEKQIIAHEIAKEEMRSGNTRAKRSWSLVCDIIIALIVLAPYVIILIAPFAKMPILVNASDYINNGINEIPNQLWILMYMVVGGNFGVSVSNIITNKKALK